MATTEQNTIDFIKRHGEKLLRLFPEATQKNPLRLYMSLRALEIQADDAALELDTIPCYEYEAAKAFDAIEMRVRRLLGCYEKDGIGINKTPGGRHLRANTKHGQIVLCPKFD